MDATSILQQLKSGQVTSEKLVEESIIQIEKINHTLNAATEILAVEAHQQLKLNIHGPLAGLPVSIKECYAIQGKEIRSGSIRMKPIPCTEDAIVVKRLKAAGAIIVARGNTSEFLLGRETDNLIYGTTKNAINPVLTAGGSSGGDGSLVASNSVAFGIGTDIGGSCRYPALFNGIVGFKPASGQINKTGIFPSSGNAFNESFNSPGILCRSVRDVRLIYDVIADQPIIHHTSVKPTIFTSTGFEVTIKDESISNALHASEEFLKSTYEVKDIPIPESGILYNLFVTMMCAGFTDKIYEWSITKEGKRLSFLGELISRMRGKPTLTHEIFSMLLPFNMFNPSESKLKKTIKEIEILRAKYNDVLSNRGVLVLPTAGVLAPPHRKFIPQYNKPGVIKIITPISFCNVLNLSCITIPVWKYQKASNTNPPGIQLATTQGNEDVLLQVAEKLEQYLNESNQ